MTTSRLEAFSDGVIAIVITILVLNLGTPGGSSFKDLTVISQKVFVYCYTFILVAIYWNNHHHLFQITETTNGSILWANNFFLFSLTLVPFSASWISEFTSAVIPQVFFGFVILLADIAFLVILALLKKNDQNGVFASMTFRKSIISIGINVIAIIVGVLIAPIVTMIINGMMLVLWIIPSKYVEDKF